MRKLRLWLGDPDDAYLEMVAKCFADSSLKERCALSTCSDAGMLASLSAQDADVALVHADLLPDAEKRCLDVVWILLAESGEPASRIGDLAFVGKYQPLERLLNAIAEHWLEQAGNLPGQADMERSRAILIAFFSAAGGSGKTTSALNLCRMLANEGRSVFYLNMESFPSIVSEFEGDGASFGRVVYGLKHKKAMIAEQFAGWRRFDKTVRCDMFPAGDHQALEWGELEEDELNALLDHLTERASYDAVVVDLDAAVHDRNLAALKRSDAIVWLLLEDAANVVKTKAARKVLAEITSGALDNRIIPILNKHTGTSESIWDAETIRPRAKLPYVPEWKTIAEWGARLGHAPFQAGMEHIKEMIADNGRFVR